MSNEEYCDWCSGHDLEWRTINKSNLIRSFVSKPWFRVGHCLVIPMRHLSSIDDLREDEAANLMLELGRLSKLLDQGFGVGVMQKYMPMQAENSVKMNHLHFHVFPRQKEEQGLFPTPYPNSFESFYIPDTKNVSELVEQLKA